MSELNASLFDGLDEADRALLRRQIEINYLKSARTGVVWTCIGILGVATAISFFTSLGPALTGDSWDEAAGICSSAMGGLCSNARMQEAQGVVQFGFWFTLICGLIIGWIVGVLIGLSGGWQRAALAKMFTDENIGALNRAAALARQQVENTIAHRRLSQDFRRD